MSILDSRGIWIVGPSEYFKFFFGIGAQDYYLRTETFLSELMLVTASQL